MIVIYKYHFILGCKARDECATVDFCPVRAEGSVCAKFGCCTYDRCVANYTLGADLETPTPSVVPMTTEPEMAASTPTSTSGCVFGLGAFALVAIGLLCGMF